MSERAKKVHALDRADTVIGSRILIALQNIHARTHKDGGPMIQVLVHLILVCKHFTMTDLKSLLLVINERKGVMPSLYVCVCVCAHVCKYIYIVCIYTRAYF
jgi:hypothetical protein